MAFKTIDIQDKTEIQINLNDYHSILEEVKQLEMLVWSLDTSGIESSYSSLGQSAYHPKMMLSLIFYGYSKGVRSGRDLAQNCKENINYIYLSRGYQISKSSFNGFRQAHYQIFANLFVQIVSKSIALNQCDASISLVDGSKLLANCSKKRTKTQEKYEKLKLTLKSDIEELEKEENNQTNILQISRQKKLLEKVEKRISQLAVTDDKTKLNLTDKDALIMKGKKGEFDTFYNVQVGCCENQIITFNDTVTNGNDKAQLIPTLKGIAQNTNQPIEKALADGDYGNFESFEYMKNENIDGYVPYTNMNTTYEEQPFHKAHFIYNPQKDTYTCPQQQILSFYGTAKDKKYNHDFKKYRTTQIDTCKNCPFKHLCSPKSVRKVIKRELREGLREEMKAKLNTSEGKQMYIRRFHPVEAIFGHLKYNLGYYHFLLRGLDKVKAEFNIMCSAYNLMKIINLTAQKASNNAFFTLFRAFQIKINICIYLSIICQRTFSVF